MSRGRRTAMTNLFSLSIRTFRHAPRRGVIAPLALGLRFSLACLAVPAGAADVGVDRSQMPLKAPAALPSFDWTGFYVGGHFGYAGGTSNWSADTVAGPGPSASGSFNLFQPFDPFTEAGSYFMGLQVGYNSMLPNRVVLGAEADVL